MKGTMMAARIHGANQIRVDEVPIPELGPDDVLVKIKAVHINGGDLHLYRGQLKPTKLPMTVLHEPAGEIEEVGSAIELLKKGDRVACDPTISCHDVTCHYCQSGLYNYCPYSGYTGMHTMDFRARRGKKLLEPYADGAFANYYKIPARNCVLIPDNVSFEIAAKSPTAAVGYGAVRRAGIVPGDTVVINAATGSMGSCVVKVALLFNPEKVIAVGQSEKKLAQIKSWAPNTIEIVSSAKENVRERIWQINKGVGANRLIDCSVNDMGKIAEQCLAGLSNCGSAVFVGGCSDKLNLAFNFFMFTGINLTGWLGCLVDDINACLKFISAGKLDFSDMITHRFPLAQASQMYDTFDKKIGDPMWVVGLLED